jgi:hypothetical protein
MRIDAHQHFWRYNPTDYSWMSDSMDILRRDHLPHDLESLLKAIHSKKPPRFLEIPLTLWDRKYTMNKNTHLKRSPHLSGSLATYELIPRGLRSEPFLRSRCALRASITRYSRPNLPSLTFVSPKT